MNSRHFLALCVSMVLLVPGTALAYVDPGLFGSLYQVAYVAVFAVMAAVVAGPGRLVRWVWDSLRRLIGRGPKKS